MVRGKNSMVEDAEDEALVTESMRSTTTMSQKRDALPTTMTKLFTMLFFRIMNQEKISNRS